MVLFKPLFLKIFEAASMQRWNDQIRTVDITELDKQAHKMVVAYVLGKLEETASPGSVNWIEIIETGFFQYLQRIVLTDLKPPLFYEIKKDRNKYLKLNRWVYDRIYPVIGFMGDDFCLRFRDYILGSGKGGHKDNNRVSPENDYSGNLNRKIVGAAHFYITKWEFDIISRFNPGGYQVEEIKKNIEKEQEKYYCIRSMERFLGSKGLLAFVDICGQLRFQIRWSHLYRVPKTSVLGHMLIVALFSYLFSCINKSPRDRKINNYFTGLFHDLPEVLTRDIINPVKKSVEGLDELIKDYEKSEMDKKIYKLLPAAWHKDIRVYTEKEFEDTQSRDGQLVKAADDLAAFIEAYLSIHNGISNENLREAMSNLIYKYRDRVISGIDFRQIYKEYE